MYPRASYAVVQAYSLIIKANGDYHNAS